MELEIGKCPVCGKTHTLIPSNNKIASLYVLLVLLKNLDYNNVEDADLFCRTYNYPFKPEL